MPVQLLAEGGYVVLSMPNISHNGVVASLLMGNFDYTETGLLDRTHIRFFGAHSIEPMLNRASLALEHVEFVTAHPRDTEFAGVWEALPLRTKLTLRSSHYGNGLSVRATGPTFIETTEPIALNSVPVPRVSESRYG